MIQNKLLLERFMEVMRKHEQIVNLRSNSQTTNKSNQPKDGEDDRS